MESLLEFELLTLNYSWFLKVWYENKGSSFVKILHVVTICWYQQKSCSWSLTKKLVRLNWIGSRSFVSNLFEDKQYFMFMGIKWEFLPTYLVLKLTFLAYLDENWCFWCDFVYIFVENGVKSWFRRYLKKKSEIKAKRKLKKLKFEHTVV